MNFLKKLFGKKPPPAAEPSPSDKLSEQPNESDLITVFDGYGRELQIIKKDWLDSVLLGTLEKQRNDPEQLYTTLAQSLRDGFFQEVLPYAKHLQTIDPVPSRAATLVGVIYLELNQLDSAERTLRDHIKKHGEEAYVLANLAKVLSKRDDVAQANTTLWRSLELDPNQDMALRWFWSLAHDRGGEEAGFEALRKLSALPGSWRAKIWIAQNHLKLNDLDAALRVYDEAIASAPRPVPAELLTAMSGDLGKSGHPVEALKLCTPLFDPAVHGLAVGNNLIKVNIDLGRFDHARALVDKLYSLKRFDFEQPLAFWETEIAKARTADETSQIVTPPRVSMLLFQGPIWLAPSSPAQPLFPTKDQDAVVICILGASAEVKTTTEVQMQVTDTTGRISRCLPLFLSEQIHLRTNALCQVLQPWIAPGAFMLSGSPYDSEMGVDQAKACQPPGDYVLLTHLVATGQPYQLFFRLLRCIDQSLLDSGQFQLNPENVEPAFNQLVEWILPSICRHAQVTPVKQPIAYQVPSSPWFNDYQLRLSQSLAVRAASMGDTRRDFLHGEREIIGGMLHQCLASPANVSLRIMLFDSLRRMKTINPQVVEEFRDKLALLQKEHPAPELAGHALDELLAEALAP